MAKTTTILDGKYKIIGLVPGPIYFQGKKWDLSKITITEANQLVKAGCKYLEKKVSEK